MSVVPVTAYPWDRLPVVARNEVNARRRMRRALSPLFAFERIDAAMAEVLSARVETAKLRTTAHGALENARAVFLEAADGSVSFALEPEPALASWILSRVLGRREPLTTHDRVLDAPTRGALAAVCVEIARRAGGTLPLRALAAPRETAPELRADVTVTLDGRPYRVTATADTHATPTAGSPFAAELVELGGLPIRLVLVAAISVAGRDELLALAAGDVWLPGRGWLGPAHDGVAPDVALPRYALTRAALSAANAERGIAVGRSDAGQLVLRGDIIALGADVAELHSGRGGDEAMSGTEETLTSIALDAPIVVRVEVGSVTLTAREWSELTPGDVLETGLRLSEPAVLRVAGREVARGELVSVDGELGVRIREILERPG
jgi:flagellar motor switch protein FliN/FliY